MDRKLRGLAKMRETIHIALKSFVRGMQDFVRPWNEVYTPPAEEKRDISRYFLRVGERLARAEQRFGEKYMKAGTHAY